MERWFRRLNADLSPWSLGCNVGRLHVRFAVDELLFKWALLSDFLHFYPSNHYSTIAPYSYIALTNNEDFILFWPYLFSVLCIGQLFVLFICFIHFIQYSFYPGSFLHCKHRSLLFCARINVESCKLGSTNFSKI